MFNLRKLTTRKRDSRIGSIELDEAIRLVEQELLINGRVAIFVQTLILEYLLPNTVAFVVV